MRPGSQANRYLAYIFWAITICLQPALSLAESRQVALPELQNDSFSPRVLYIENPRFPGATEAELRTVLQRAFQLVETHFGVTARMPERIETVHIDHVFADLVANKPDYLDRLFGDFRGGRVQWRRVRKALVKQIEKQTDPLDKQIAFARPYLTEPVAGEDLDAFADAVLATYKRRLTYWKGARLDDGNPVIGRVPGRDDLPLNEYIYWAFMAKSGVDAEIVLTNQLVASVEYGNVPIHTSIRGGITGGSTEYNPASPLGALVWVSLFPYLTDDLGVTELRNSETYERNDALGYAAAMVAHELGHMLLHLGHPWSNEACVMRPAEILDFANWVRKFDAAKCRVGSSPAMTPGTIIIPIW